MASGVLTPDGTLTARSFGRCHTDVYHEISADTRERPDIAEAI
jgi:aminoglycoside N3'-acetyltransferase